MPVLNRVPYRNLILTGHMGAGKTAVGNAIARSLTVDFYDVDNEIEIQEKQSLDEIRELFGEARIRALESNYIRELKLVRSSVIAVNGPTLLDINNLQTLQETGPTLCLTAALNEVLRRLHVALGANFHSPDARSVALGRLKRERRVLEIDLPQLDTTGLSIEEVAERATQFWMQHADN
jgi:shikimate kinase